MPYDKILLDKVYAMYNEGNLNNNPICITCKECAQFENRELIHGPLPIFHIGKDFSTQEKRLLIVGMVAYGGSDFHPDSQNMWQLLANNSKNIIEDIQNSIEDRIEELFNRSRLRYMRYLSYAINQAFGNAQNGYDKIAITNLVHCNNNTDDSTADTLPQTARKFCIDPQKLGLIYKEIKVLEPTHVLILTQQWRYTKYLVGLYGNPFAISEIGHPSAPGRSKEGFANELIEFLAS